MDNHEVCDLTGVDDSKPAARSAPEVFDLTDGDAPVIPLPKKRKRAKPDTPIRGDVIDLDKAASKQKNQEETYKSSLGPVRMDFVEKFVPPHIFQNSRSALTRVSTNQIYRELLEYKLNLPIAKCSSIFVRALESRLDLLRVIITGPENTPYSHGIYVFDIHLNNYPQQAPHVKFHSSNVRINPNLYENGKVCLSLLGTWSGPGWIPNQSTLLQVLVSIQGLVLVAEPFFNEPGYHKKMRGAMTQSAMYDEKVQGYTLQHSILAMLQFNQYPEFEEVIRRHFFILREDVQTLAQSWNPKLAAQISKLLEQNEAIMDSSKNDVIEIS